MLRFRLANLEKGYIYIPISQAFGIIDNGRPETVILYYANDRFVVWREIPQQVTAAVVIDSLDVWPNVKAKPKGPLP